MSEVSRLAERIEAVAGVFTAKEHYEHLAATAAARAQTLELTSLRAYLDLLSGPRADAEWRLFLPLITVKESSFFRTPAQFRLLAAKLLPELAAARRNERRLRLWSAGCARGEEPGPLASLLSECRH